jgi:hypothetical protein
MYVTGRGLGTYVGWPICGYSGQAPALPSPGLSGIRRGLGCGCGCGGVCSSPRGLGLFDSTDYTTWGWMEWSVVAVGAFMIISTLRSLGRGGRRVARTYRKIRRAPQRRAKERAGRLRREAREIEESVGVGSSRKGGFF